KTTHQLRRRLMGLPFLLTFATLGFVAVFAYVNARVTRRMLDEGSAKRSTLCATSEHWKGIASKM
ncbi:MAG: hypothetical protein AAF618_03340, partial [Pseudomonadota bacterium]